MLALWLLASLGPFQEPCPARWEAFWSCESSPVEVGQPFELVLDLYHGPDASPSDLFAGEPALDDSWVLLEHGSAQPLAIIHEPETRLAKFVWRIASLEPGERDLSGAVASISFGERIKKIDAGQARISVRGVLAEGEDAPRPLREFPEGFAPGATSPARSRGLVGAALATLLVLAAGALLFLWRLRARRARTATPVTPLDRLGEIERALEQADEDAQAGCFALTRLLRSATDAARAQPRDGLTDEEWLAELRGAPEIPPGALEDLDAVFERAAAVKYAGQRPTPWALRETLTRARVALQIVAARGPAR